MARARGARGVNAYIARYCLSAGVPRLWLEDAVQDCEVAMWRRGLDKRSAWSLAIDAARVYGRRNRSVDRGEQRPLEEAEAIATGDAADLPLMEKDLRRRLRRASRLVYGRDRLVLAAWLRGYPLWRIGRALGISESRAAAVKRRAVCTVRNALLST